MATTSLSPAASDEEKAPGARAEDDIPVPASPGRQVRGFKVCYDYITSYSTS